MSNLIFIQDTLEKYGLPDRFDAAETLLYLDSWRRLGPNQRGKPCGRGWVGLRGACKRGKKSDDNTAKIKESKIELADKIRVKKGMRDRNAPKVLPPKIEPPTLKKAADLKEGDRIRFAADRHDTTLGDYEVTGRIERLGMKYIQATKLTSTGKPTGKSKIFLEEYLQNYSNKNIDLNPGPIEKAVRVKKEKPQPIEDMNKGRLGPSISPSNVVATDKRFTSASINNALDQIQSEGAAERLSNVRSIIEAQGIQAVFRGKGDNNTKLSEGVENKGRWHERMSEQIANLDDEIEQLGFKHEPTVKMRDRLRQKRDKILVGNSDKAFGYTTKEGRHVVVLADKPGEYPSFKVTPKEMQDMADKALSPSNERPVFTVGSSGEGAAWALATYIHEVGHQVQWISESKDPSLAAKGRKTKPVTRYGAANKMENFAEGFALWTLDAKGLKAKNPEMHDYIQESVTAAMGAKRRMDSITNGLVMGTIAPVQPSDIAQTSLGQQAFTIVLSGDSSWDAYKSLDSYAAAAKVGDEQDETMAAIEAFIVAGGEFTEPIDFSRNDSTHFDASEITRYTRAIASLNDRYNLHLDAKKVLRKIGGRRPGKRCKNGWIAAERQCSDHKTKDGKLTAAGKSSASELAARVRDRKGMQDKRGVTLARMSLEKFMEPIKGAATEKQLAPGFRKMHKEERSELNKRRINGGRGAIVDKGQGVESLKKQLAGLDDRIESEQKARTVRKTAATKAKKQTINPSQLNSSATKSLESVVSKKVATELQGHPDKAKVKRLSEQIESINSEKAKDSFSDEDAVGFRKRSQARNKQLDGIKGELKKLHKTVQANKPQTLEDRVKGILAAEGKLEKTHRTVNSRRQATKREATSGNIVRLRDSAKESLARDARELLSQGKSVPSSVLEVLGGRINYNEKGEYKPVGKRSDGDERWDSAIDRISIKYGLHLDDWKRLGPNQMGKPCGRGWVGLRGACKRGKKGDDNTAKIKESKAALADRIRARKSMSTIRSRNGKTAQGDWDIGSAYAPLKERQSTMMAARTSAAKTKMSPNPDRASRMMNKESDRARVEWGRATGDWKQKPDSTAAMDMDRVQKSRPTSTKGADYLGNPGTNKSMATHEGVKKIAEAIDFNGGWIDTGSHTSRTSPSGSVRIGMVQVKKLNPPSKASRWGSATVVKDYGEKEGKQTRNISLPQLADGVRQTEKQAQTTTKPTPIESGKSLKSLFAEADRIGAKYQDKPATMEERRTSKQGADRILQESGVTEAVARSTGVASMEKARERKSNDPAPMQSATRKMNAEAPKSKSNAGDRIRAIADKLEDEQNTQKFATGKIIQAAGKIWQNHENLIKEVATIANDDLDKAAKFARLSPAEQRREMENAPVSIPNSRKSSEPRKRGRSVD